MNPDYRIRKANLSDLDSLVAFAIQEATETEGHSPAPDAVTIGVQKGFEEIAPSSYWVAESNEGEIVGAISVVTEWSNFRGGYYWWVQSLFIASDHRGRGLVDDLLRFIARTAAPLMHWICGSMSFSQITVPLPHTVAAASRLPLTPS